MTLKRDLLTSNAAAARDLDTKKAEKTEQNVANKVKIKSFDAPICSFSA